MKFSYKAVSANGSMTTDGIEAESEDAALRLLLADGKKVMEIKPASRKGVSRSASTAPLNLELHARLFEDVAVLLNAGMNIDQAILAVKNGAETKNLRGILTAIHTKVSLGKSLSAAMADTKKFAPEVTALVASGESTSSLAVVFGSLAADYSIRADLRQKLVEALTYPVFLILLALCSVTLIAFALVPALLPIFESAEAVPPLVVRLLAGLRDMLTEYGWVITLCGVSIVLFSVLPTTKVVLRSAMLKIWMQMPVVGTIAMRLSLSRYLRSLALLLSNKVDMPSALRLAANVVATENLRELLSGVETEVSRGARLPSALQNTKLFSDDIISIVGIGDDVNRLSLVIDRASVVLQSKAQRQIDRSLAFLTPVITISLGLLIGVLVVSVMTTLLSVNDLAIG